MLIQKLENIDNIDNTIRRLRVSLRTVVDNNVDIELISHVENKLSDTKNEIEDIVLSTNNTIMSMLSTGERERVTLVNYITFNLEKGHVERMR